MRITDAEAMFFGQRAGQGTAAQVQAPNGYAQPPMPMPRAAPQGPNPVLQRFAAEIQKAQQEAAKARQDAATALQQLQQAGAQLAALAQALNGVIATVNQLSGGPAGPVPARAAVVDVNGAPVPIAQPMPDQQGPSREDAAWFGGHIDVDAVFRSGGEDSNES